MKRCPSGKVGYSSLAKVRSGAKVFARRLNERHVIAETMYAYRCDECSHFHLSRAKTFAGVPNTLVFTAPPEELQRWAMGEA